MLLPGKTSIFIHGCRDDSERLRQAVRAGDVQRTCVLFPSDASTTVDSWVADAASQSLPERGEVAGKEETPRLSFTVILVDGTWHQARKMNKCLLRTLLPGIRQVALTLSGPASKSVFHRKQSQEGRICTAEATSLFVRELLSATGAEGADPATAASDFHAVVVAAIELLNRAIAPTRLEPLWHGSGGNPAWYYGDRVIDGLPEVKPVPAKLASAQNAKLKP